jgi:bifunctional UDP-N-acetylglucosamine pyrophosphorylase/glucosamine-1-phosphate N-acetyltransferase
MSTTIGLIFSDNQNKFESKKSLETHNILGKTIQEWSLQSLENVVEKSLLISNNDINKIKEALQQGTSAVIMWSNQPLMLNETVKKLVDKHCFENNDASAIKSDKGAVYVFDTGVLAAKIDELNIAEFNRDVVEIIFTSTPKRSVSFNDVKNELYSVRDRIDLSKATNEIKNRINNSIMLSGVTLIDPASTYIDAEVSIGMDTVIMPNTILRGNTVIGEDCTIGPSSTLTNAKIGNNTEVVSSVIIDSSVANETHVGPFAYLRPGSCVGSNVKIGDFVEIKKSVIGDRTKISHLTYVGDAEIGKNVNMGCGVVVVNYDGKNKNKTVVGDNSFIGCNVNLVSPVEVKNDAYVAAGSTITDEVPENALAIARARQVNKEGWVVKKDLKRR